MRRIKVGLIGAILGFKNMKKFRDQVIKSSRPERIIGRYKINDNAKLMHPDFQELVVEKEEDYFDGEAKSYILASEYGKKLAYFRAGQALSLKLQIGSSFVTRSFSISSSPKEVYEGFYRITVKRKENGFVSNYILDTFRNRTRVVSSAPYGNFYYEKFRDNKNVVAIAGGSGITPFVSMANAIKDGIEDFNLTILYGNNDENILFKEELDSITRKCDKVKVIYVIANKKIEGCEYGYITSELISKYAVAPYTVFVSGTAAMHEFISKELSMLHINNKDIRYETLACDSNYTNNYNYPRDVIGEIFKIKVIQGPYTQIIDAKGNETLLVAFERAGIKAPSKCRGGECGWCRSKLVVGNVSNIKRDDQRRYSDIEYNYIHPCCCYPTSDCTIEIPSEYI